MLLATEEDDVEMAVLIIIGVAAVAMGAYNMLGGLLPAISLSGDGRRFMMLNVKLRCEIVIDGLCRDLLMCKTSFGSKKMWAGADALMNGQKRTLLR